jgi:hypothetical protein
MLFRTNVWLGEYLCVVGFFICLSFHLFIYLSIYLFIYLFIYFGGGGIDNLVY